ncbi:MAG TPA: HD domain-containing protein, partial [Thermomicrobiales bacterium]|nr:HD domain-containing protein [Thermomicrobiales bacterium]
MAEVTEALRRGVRVVEAWALALAESECARIEELPASGNPGTPALARGTQADHIRGGARLALAVADTPEARLGPLGVDRDLLLAAALCHDVGKPYEVSPRNQAR